MIQDYSGISPMRDLQVIQRLCERLRGKTFLHINSTREGGGVAEILQRMIPVLRGLGIDARWEVIEGDKDFFDVTKSIHNTLQGNRAHITDSMWKHYEEVNRTNSAYLDFGADMVLIHDPQPAPLIGYRKKGFWTWRCHIDTSSPLPEVWERLEKFVKLYDSAIYSVPKFTKALPIKEFIIPPSIDPLSDKNREMSDLEISGIMKELNVPIDKPIILQVSRFDRFKDPIGVIQAYNIVKKYNDCRLVLAGSSAKDDPEGEQVLNEVLDYSGDDPDMHILLLPTMRDREINALQRSATIILQKSTKEGFGLTVSEAMWKEKPVIGGAVGGIPFQIIHGLTGFLVHSVEGAAFRIRQFLNNPDMADRIGKQAKEYVKNNFLITRQIRDYLSLWYAHEMNGKSVISL
jgi:trehalose synthase